MTIRWINSSLGTAAARECLAQEDLFVLDVRDLVDKEGNAGDLVRKKIATGLEMLQSGKRLVVCCDLGSRSNAVAPGDTAKMGNYCR